MMTNEADSFRVLYEANRKRVWRFLARIVGPQEAEDLCQTVFANVARALPSFRGEAQPSTWLYRIAANVAADWLRSRPVTEAKVTAQLPDVLNGEVDEVSARSEHQPSPEQELIRKEMSDCVRNVVAQLPEDHRTVLMLGELGGFTDDEIAQALGVSRSSAKVRLHRARARLKKALEARCEFYRNEDNEFACEPKAAAGCAPSQRSGCSSTAGSNDSTTH